VIAEITTNILNGIKTTQKEEINEYIGAENLKYCGECHTRKERTVSFLGQEERKVTILCECKTKEREAKRESIRKEEEMNNIKRARISSMMDETFQTATFETFQQTDENEKYYKTALNYSKKFKSMYENNQGLLFYGNVGTGKSHTAACIANYLLENNRSVVMTSFVRILQELKGFDKGREDMFFDKLNTASLLIIDDLGAERSTDYALEKVYGIIDNRYRAKKPLILTSNLTLKQMQEMNDIRYERIYDRIFEMCYPVKFAGASWRKREAAHRFETTKKALEA